MERSERERQHMDAIVSNAARVIRAHARQIVSVGNSEMQADTAIVNLSETRSKVTVAINQLSNSVDPDATEIKRLLTQLQSSIETASELDEEEKVEALEQVVVLANIGKFPAAERTQKCVKRSILMLRGIVAGLPPTAKLAKDVGTILPVIANLYRLK